MSRVSKNIDPTAQAAIADLTITFTTDNPGSSANGVILIADGDGSPTAAERNDIAIELTAKVNAILAALRATGVINS